MKPKIIDINETPKNICPLCSTILPVQGGGQFVGVPCLGASCIAYDEAVNVVDETKTAGVCHAFPEVRVLK